ncbi:MAG TPA: terminase TerL endonuclease subunit, partial [Reyranella sp.]|nr:terminase TerL endonuclease subunit [Reyranella sp.]
PWQALNMAQRFQAQGVEVVEYRNTVANFSAPMKEIEGLARQGRLHHNGDPILAWMISNVVCHVDAKDNIYPRKERPENKIDGVVAAIMALGRRITNDANLGSIYDDPKMWGKPDAPKPVPS